MSNRICLFSRIESTHLNHAIIIFIECTWDFYGCHVTDCVVQFSISVFMCVKLNQSILISVSYLAIDRKKKEKNERSLNIVIIVNFDLSIKTTSLIRRLCVKSFNLCSSFFLVKKTSCCSKSHCSFTQLISTCSLTMYNQWFRFSFSLYLSKSIQHRFQFWEQVEYVQIEVNFLSSFRYDINVQSNDKMLWHWVSFAQQSMCKKNMILRVHYSDWVKDDNHKTIE